MLTPEECYQISQAVYRSSFAAFAANVGDDLVQEGVIGIWKGQKSYKSGLASEKTFASRLARNAMIDALRRFVRPNTHEAPTDDFTLVGEPAVEEDLSAPEASEAWSRLENSLADGTRKTRWRAIVSGRILGLADSEIAYRLGISKASLSREAGRLAAQAALALGLTASRQAKTH